MKHAALGLSFVFLILAVASARDTLAAEGLRREADFHDCVIKKYGSVPYQSAEHYEKCKM